MPGSSEQKPLGHSIDTKHERNRGRKRFQHNVLKWSPKRDVSHHCCTISTVKVPLPISEPSAKRPVTHQRSYPQNAISTIHSSINCCPSENILARLSHKDITWKTPQRLTRPLPLTHTTSKCHEVPHDHSSHVSTHIYHQIFSKHPDGEDSIISHSDKFDILEPSTLMKATESTCNKLESSILVRSHPINRDFKF